MPKQETTAQREKRESIANAREYLLKHLKPGATARTILRSVSRSGMNRKISVVVTDEDGPSDATWAVARVLGSRIDGKTGAISVNGCGMDMGFHVVYSLSHALYPKGHGCIGERCPSNDHSNGDRDYTPSTWPDGLPGEEGNRHWHFDGGYALRHRWL